MARHIINIGQTPNDRTGDPLRTAFEKINDNFSELYALSGSPTELSQDTVDELLVNGEHNGVIVVYDDDNNKLNLSVNIDGGDAFSEE
jgi:hypothetical protein